MVQPDRDGLSKLQFVIRGEKKQLKERSAVLTSRLREIIRVKNK
jgi:hypothetical protein